MSDGRDPTAPTADEPAQPRAEQPADPPSRRASAGAQAASRARRIGGRPSPGPRPSPRPAAEDAATTSDELDGPTPPRPSRAARGARAAAAERSAKAAASDTSLIGPTAPPVSDGDGRKPRSDADTERLRRQVERLRWIPAVVAGVLAAAMLVLCVWQSHGVWWGKQQHDDRSQVRQQVLAAAKPCVAAIVSYDYRKLPASEKAGQACITGAFKADYTKAMETTVKTLAPQTKTVQVFQVAKAGIERVSPDGKQWVVLLYGQQQVTNSSTAKNKPRLDILNVEATMNKVGNKWLVSSIH
jgi:hypothetical protein